MEDIETEKYKAYKQKLLENISNQVETELIAEMASTTKKSKIVSNIKKEQLDKLSIDELSNYMDNYSDPSEIQVIYFFIIIIIIIQLLYIKTCKKDVL